MDRATRGVAGSRWRRRALWDLDAIVPRQLAAQRGAGGSNGAQADSTLALARFLNNTAYRDLPPKAIEHAKMILASTFASAATGSVIDSARILRQLAKEQGGKPEATIWFDGTKVPASEAARVNAILSDAAASDDSDIRNTAHEGTTLAVGGSRHRASAPAPRVRTCSAR